MAVDRVVKRKLEHIRTYCKAASESRPRLVKEILEVARQDSEASGELYSALRKITSMEEEEVKVVGELHGA